VIQAVKPESEWRLTVERMMQHASDPDFLTQDEKGEIIRYLTQKR
jgi:hypothetical protein